jgi:formylglycine-generating enzyme required for sulfatase activity
MTGFDTNVNRVLRGGDYGDNPAYLRSAFRFGLGPGNRRGNHGFRLVRTHN